MNYICVDSHDVILTIINTAVSIERYEITKPPIKIYKKNYIALQELPITAVQKQFI